MLRTKTDFVSPYKVLGAATAFFGGSISLDPASSELANTVVEADKIFTPRENGLFQDWKAKNIYLYPPRDFLDYEDQPKNRHLFKKTSKIKRSAQRVWLERAIDSYKKQDYTEGIVFLTSTEVALIVTQKLNIDLPLCLLNERPQLLVESPGLPKVQDGRCYGFVFYVPSPYNTEKRIYEFREVFSSIGRVYI